MVNIIGIDCAANLNRTGITYSKFFDKEWLIKDIKSKLEIEELKKYIVKSIRENEKVIISLDTPLGWSNGLIGFLNKHVAGKFFNSNKYEYKSFSEHLFKRETDRIIKEKLKINPFEIGADKIARASLKTFEILDQIEKGTGIKPELIWSSTELGPLSIIEVYPKATLVGFGFYDEFKESATNKTLFQKEIANVIIPKEQENRQKLLDQFVERTNKKTDDFDSLICAFTAKEFLLDNLCSPERWSKSKIDMIRKEGWIWTKLL